MRQVEIHGKGPGGVALVALLALFTACGENSRSDVEDESGTAVVTGVVHSATILFDLNTELWLDGVVVSEGIVAASDVQGATNVLVR